ncbi:MAG: OmpH family outer membrane protein [Muribaculaceae bacterium]|nr:OmpH family outer membrane protein [Muribaculaceae bacterium]
MFKKILIAAALALPMMAAAQTVKIGLVDVNAVMQSMPATAAAEKQLQELQSKYEAQAKSLQEDLQKQATELQALQDDATTPKATMDRKIGAFQDSQARYQQFLRQVDQDLTQKHQELLLPITTDIKNAIESVGREGSYTLIQNNDPSITFYYAAPAEDITPLVKTKLGIK